MTDNIFTLVKNDSAKPTPSQPLIEWLERRLEEAKSGDLQGMVGACAFEDAAEYFVMGYVGGFDVIGALQTSQYCLVGILPEN